MPPPVFPEEIGPAMANLPSKQEAELPQRKHIRLPIPDYHIHGAWYFVTICCEGKKSYMRNLSVRNDMQSILENVATSNRVEVAAYSILTNHLHMVCSAGEIGLVDFLRIFKSKTARAIRKKANPAFEWQRSFFDHKIRNDASLDEKCRYVLENPVRLGLCSKADDYPWNGRVISE